MKTKTNSLLICIASRVPFISSSMRPVLIMMQLFTCALLFAAPLTAHPMVVTAKDTSVCAGATVPLTGSPSGGTWSGTGVTGSSFSAAGLTAGVYSVTYTVAGLSHCRTAVAHVTVNPLPIVTAADANVCEGGTVPLFGSPCCPIGGTWSGEGVRGIVFIAGSRTSGTFPVTYHYTDAHGCTDSAVAHVTIHPLPIVTARDTNVCAGASVPLTGFPSGGVWSGDGVTGSVFNSAGQALGHHAFTYVYTDSNHCSNFAYSHVTVNPLPVVTATDANVCEGGTVPLFGTPCCPIGGTWSGEGVRGIVFIAGLRTSGVFPVTYHFTDSNGCTDSATAHVTIHPRPVVTVKDKEVCEGATVHLSGHPSGGSWSGSGVSGSVFDAAGLTPGHYVATYSYTDTNRCTSSTSAHVIVKPQPVLTAENKDVCKGHEVELVGAPSGGTWSGYGVSGSFFNAAGISPGVYTVAYWTINPGGCVSSTSAIVTVNKCSCGCMRSGNGVTEPDDYTVYPNPSDGSFYMYVPALAADATAIVVDIFGRIVDKRTLSKSDNAQELAYNLRNIAPGIYNIRVDNNTTHYSEKMVVK